MPDIKIPAVISKLDIAKYVELIGCINGKPIAAPDMTYPAASLVLVNAEFVPDADAKLWRGNYILRDATLDDSSFKKFDSLPGIGGSNPKKPAAE